jgi:hypothetical protein
MHPINKQVSAVAGGLAGVLEICKGFRGKFTP